MNRFNSNNTTKESLGNQAGRTNVIKAFEGGVEVLHYFKKKRDSFENIHESALALCPDLRFQPSSTEGDTRGWRHNTLFQLTANPREVSRRINAN